MKKITKTNPFKERESKVGKKIECMEITRVFSLDVHGPTMLDQVQKFADKYAPVKYKIVYKKK